MRGNIFLSIGKLTGYAAEAKWKCYGNGEDFSLSADWNIARFDCDFMKVGNQTCKDHQL